jgi:hypothetical protein
VILHLRTIYTSKTNNLLPPARRGTADGSLKKWDGVFCLHCDEINKGFDY